VIRRSPEITAHRPSALLAEALGPLLDARGHLYRAFLDIDKRVRALAHDDPICQLLMSAPGVGFVAALTFKAAVDDPSRFRRSKTVAAHFGLTPRRYQSGERDNPGHISKAGDVEVRSALFLAANMILNGRGPNFIPTPLRCPAGPQDDANAMPELKTNHRRWREHHQRYSKNIRFFSETDRDLPRLPGR
jgi:transposase